MRGIAGRRVSVQFICTDAVQIMQIKNARAFVRDSASCKSEKRGFRIEPSYKAEHEKLGARVLI